MCALLRSKGAVTQWYCDTEICFAGESQWRCKQLGWFIGEHLDDGDMTSVEDGLSSAMPAIDLLAI